MLLKGLLFLLLGITLASVGATAKAQSSLRYMTSGLVNDDCSMSVEHVNPNSLAQEIAQMDIERVLLGVVFMPTHPEFALLNQRQSGLKACLAKLQPNESNDLVVEASISATESKIAEFEERYARNQIIFIDSSPEQQYLREALEALRQHLATLQ